MILGQSKAKLNLTLRIVGRRGDGYHLMQSLVAFAEIGDGLRVGEAKETSLTIGGPFGDRLESDERNLVMKAAQSLRQLGHSERHARMVLSKELPVASGLGGGSGDAALALTLLNRLWQLELSFHELEVIAGALGADVTACLHERALWMEGIGDRCTPLKRFPDCWVVLINPLVPLPTAEVFERYAAGADFSMQATLPEGFSNYRDLVRFLSMQKNDLTAAAVECQPVIKTILDALALDAHCDFATLSGSGATCIGLTPSHAAATELAEEMRMQFPGYWVVAAKLN